MKYLSVLFYLILTITPVFSEQIFVDRQGKEFRIAVAKTVDDIDLLQGRDVLVRGFMEGYKDVSPEELNPEFKSQDDVKLFYENYFDSELEHYRKGELIWVQAFEGEKLLGWSTFQREEDEHAFYMNLLVVAPEEHGKGVGKHLTFFIRSEELFPKTQEIRLLLRKVNEGGRQFYEKIGFSDFNYDRTDNFVDLSLLTGLRWMKNQ